MTDNKNQSLEEKDLSNARYLTFTLCEEQYAIPLLQVKEVIGYTETTPIPQAPAYFKGIINLRGQIISIIDLRSKLKLSKAEFAAETSIIILDLSPYMIGVVVDSIDCVLTLENSEVDRSKELETFSKAKYISGVAKKDKQLILLLDIQATLDVEDMKVISNKKNAA